MLWIKFLQLLFLPIDLILGFVEKVFLPKMAALDQPIVFVVGIHRTGSTFVSQVLADCFPFALVGNHNTLFPRSKYFIHLLFKRFYKKGKFKNKSYKSYYGISRGFYSIGDSYEIWDKWMGKSHYYKPDEISIKKRSEMIDYFAYLSKSWGKTIIAKNNRNMLMIGELQEIFPNAFFVIVNRGRADVIQSTIQASKDFFGSDEYMWGLRPTKEFSMGDYDSKMEAYCRQYIELEKVLQEQLQGLDPDKYIEVQYEEFCSDPVRHLDLIKDKISVAQGTTLVANTADGLSYKSSQRLSDSVLVSQIETMLAEVDHKASNRS
ncbi:MAG: hypothetical protein COB85_00030 [Bacteroidetes bacterium]|nr:MAG: hypothetical protein COB85_00030 [Bacteroidota bacterium]